MRVWPVIDITLCDRGMAQGLALDSAEIAAMHGCHGLFLISRGRNDNILAKTASSVKDCFKELAVGIKQITDNPSELIKKGIGFGLDAVWSDQIGISNDYVSPIAMAAAGLLKDYPDFTFFGSVASKYQPIDINPGRSAQSAWSIGMVPTTSKTPSAHSLVEKLAVMRKQLDPKAPLGLAGGLNEKNIRDYSPFITDAFIASCLRSKKGVFCGDCLSSFMNIANIAPNCVDHNEILTMMHVG